LELIRQAFIKDNDEVLLRVIVMKVLDVFISSIISVIKRFVQNVINASHLLITKLVQIYLRR